MTPLDRSIKMLEMGDFGYIKNIVTEIKRRNDYTEVKSVIKILKKRPKYHESLFNFLSGLFPVLSCKLEEGHYVDPTHAIYMSFKIRGGISLTQRAFDFLEEDFFMGEDGIQRIYVYPYAVDDDSYDRVSVINETLFLSRIGKTNFTPRVCHGPVAQGEGLIMHTEQEFLSLISENFNLDLENVNDRRKAEIT